MSGTSSAVFLSVIIPVLNRERLVLRAIRSALADLSTDIEVIVVDDGSTDGTAASVASVVDARLRLVQLSQNVGQCPARNRGAAAARGEWLVFLDSDDELSTGALEAIRCRTQAANARVGKLLFSCRDDSGAVSPRPALHGQVVNYVGYLEWLEGPGHGDRESLPCVRRAAFLTCPYPEARRSPEGIHELDFAARYELQLCPEIVRLYHFDANNRLMMPDTAALLSGAGCLAQHAELVLARHGPALWHHAPNRWTALAREAALYNFLTGYRRKGAYFSFALLRRAPANLYGWVVLMAGILGRRPLGRLWSLNRARTAEA